MASFQRKAPEAITPEAVAAIALPACVPSGLLDQVHDGVIATDLDGIVHTWNAAAERIYGFAAAEMIGQSVAQLYFPEDQPTVGERVLAPLRMHGVHHLEELRTRHKGGAELFVDVRLSLQRDDAGRPIGMIGCSNDVTAHRRARHHSLRQREELRAILDGVPAMVWYKDRDNRIVRANRDAAAWARLMPAEVEGRSFYDLFPVEAAQYHRDDLEVIETGVPKLGVIESVRAATGEQRWVRKDKVPYRDEHGEIVGVIVFAVDITEQKRTELALEQARDTLDERVRERTAELAAAVDDLRLEIGQHQQAEQRLELALWATDLGMWEWNARGAAPVCDARWAEMLGYGADADAVRQPTTLWEAVTHPDDRAAAVVAWNAHVRDGSAPHYEIEHRVRTAQGEERWILTRGKVVERGPDGAALRITGTNRDITVRKLMAEQVSRHQAELAHVLRLETVNCLAAELAHEINQPLGAIANYANGLAARLRRGEVDRDTMLGAAERMGGQALRAGTVLQRLRSFVRKDALCEQVCDLNELVDTAASLVEPEARHHGVTLRLIVAAQLPPVRVDPIQIEQVIVNLLRNGLEAIVGQRATHGALAVTTRCGGNGEIELRVSDSGCGVAAEVRERLFEPFFTTKPNGLGMGLSISRSIVEAHGGRLWLDTDGGVGATFCVSLPAAAAA